MLAGGAGADRLDGGDGADVLRGGSGEDQLYPDGLAADNDWADGGAGLDTVLYERGRGRTIDLRGRFPGGGGEREALSSVEDVFAGDRDDVIFGSARGERIFAAGGNDVVRAGGGHDYVDPGVDRVSAGGGRAATMSSTRARTSPTSRAARRCRRRTSWAVASAATGLSGSR